MPDQNELKNQQKMFFKCLGRYKNREKHAVLEFYSYGTFLAKLLKIRFKLLAYFHALWLNVTCMIKKQLKDIVLSKEWADNAEKLRELVGVFNYSRPEKKMSFERHWTALNQRNTFLNSYEQRRLLSTEGVRRNVSWRKFAKTESVILLNQIII